MLGRDLGAIVSLVWSLAARGSEGGGGAKDAVGRGGYYGIHKITTFLDAALDYQSTRHTYGGRFVSNGGSLEKLGVILGHSTTEVTLRYGHLVKGQFS